MHVHRSAASCLPAWRQTHACRRVQIEKAWAATTMADDCADDDDDGHGSLNIFDSDGGIRSRFNDDHANFDDVHENGSHGGNDGDDSDNDQALCRIVLAL